MTKRNNTDFRDLLKNEIEKKLKGHQRYFSREDLRNLVPGGRLGTFNKYLVDFGKEGILRGAGRGWYSFVKQPFELDQRPVKKNNRGYAGCRFLHPAHVPTGFGRIGREKGH